MNNSKLCGNNLLKNQQGIATLLTSVVLSILAVITTLTITQTSVVEQQITSNDVRAQEAMQGAEAVLDYGMAWAQSNELPASAADPSGASCFPPSSSETSSTDCPTPTVASMGLSSNNSSGESYTYQLSFLEQDEVIKVTASVWSESEDNIEAVSDSFLVQSRKGIFKGGVSSPKPFVLDGCYDSNSSQTGVIYLLDDSNDSVLNSSGSNCDDSQIGGIDKQTWTDSNGNRTYDSGDSSSNVSSSNTFGEFTCGLDSCVWNHYFNIDIEDAKEIALESTSPTGLPCGASQSAFYYISATGNINGCEGSPNKTIGSPDAPVVLIVNSNGGDCSKFNGGITVYGIVYQDGPCNDNNGWGNATLYGSTMFEGSSGPPTSNSTKYYEVDFGDNPGGLNETFVDLGVEDANRIPGTWKDF